MNGNLVWMDLEFTGLDPDSNGILEIATLITDVDLNVLSEGPNLVIHHSEEVLGGMDEWNTRHHTESGLLEKSKTSLESHETADQKTVSFLSLHCPSKSSPLCGNSIHQDRRFLFKYMPLISAHLHYRNIDVSSLKELAKRWKPALPEYKKKGGHRALDDIRESIEELKYYRTHLIQ